MTAFTAAASTEHFAPRGGMARNDRLRRPTFQGEHRLHPRRLGRHHRQAIGPALLVAVLDGATDIGVDLDRRLFEETAHLLLAPRAATVTGEIGPWTRLCTTNLHPPHTLRSSDTENTSPRHRDRDGAWRR